MPKWKGIVGKPFTPMWFLYHVQHQQWTKWNPTGIVLHNTAAPRLSDRPHGFTTQHMQNLVAYYQNPPRQWSAGPHLFVDDRQIWVFTPLTESGVHSPSYNSTHFGIEMLGDYNLEPFNSGRGLLVQKNAVAACAVLCKVRGIDSHDILLHKEDPRTDHDCPGKRVVKADFIQKVHDYIVNEL